MKKTQTKVELIARIAELEMQLENDKNVIQTLLRRSSAGNVITLKNALELKTRAVSLLKEVVEMSCKDHCPHHAMVEACRNCAIKKKMLELAVF